jgi:hypothetical protein
MEKHEYTASDGQTYDLEIPDAGSFYDYKQRLEGAIAAKRVQQAPIAAAGMAGTGGFLRGMPIAGPALEAGAKGAAARTRSLISGQPFPEELGSVEAHAKAAEEAHPTAETVGEIGGGITGYGAMAAAAPYAMGAAGSMPVMMGMGGLSGGMLGAADAYMRGQSPVAGGAAGSLSGVGGPVVGAVGGHLLQPFGRAIRAGLVDPALQAHRDIAAAMRRARGMGDTTRLSPQEVAAARARGQPVTPMEVGGEPGRALTRSAANISDEARGIATQRIMGRFEQQTNRWDQWLGTRFHYPNAEAQQQALDQVERTVNKAAYNKAYEEGAGGIWSKGIAAHWEDPIVQDAARKAMETVRRDARLQGYQLKPNDMPLVATEAGPLTFARGPDGKVMVPSLRFWDQVQRNLRDAGRAAGPGTHAANQVEGVRKALVEELDTRVPAFATARRGAAQAFGAESALEAGQMAVTSKMNNRVMRANVAKMSQQERQLFQDGYIDRLIQGIRESPDRRNVANYFFNSPGARERLEIAVGKDQAKEIEAFIRVENVMDFARQALGNSKTAQYMTELTMVGGGTEAYDWMTGSPMTDPTGAIIGSLLGGSRLLGRKGAEAINRRVAVHIAQMMTSQDPSAMTRAVKVIAGNPGLFDAIKHADAAIGQVLAEGSVPAALKGIFGVGPRTQEQPQPTYGGSIE